MQTGEKGTFPKQMPITILTSTKTTRNFFLLALTKEEAIPNPYTQDGSFQQFFSFPQVGRVKWL